MELLPGVIPGEEPHGIRLRVAFTLLPRFTLTAFAGFVDALRLAGDVGDRSQPRRVAWKLVGHDTHPVASSCGAAIAHSATFADPAEIDCLVVVGGTLGPDLRYEHDLLRYIRRVAERDVLLVGLCTGVFALAEAGVMEGHRTCVHGYHIRDFQIRFPHLATSMKQIYVEDGRRLTCAGGVAAIDAAGRVIERHFGAARARKLLPHMLVDELRQPAHAQLSFVENFFEVQDERVRMAVFLMQQNLSEPSPIAQIARAVGVPLRQLERGFRKELGVAPRHFYRNMRLERARWLLQHSPLTITQIAFACGFADASHLTRSFKQHFGELPSAYRARRPPAR
jgi:transcriptional regulator GlxA family with amidase domain